MGGVREHELESRALERARGWGTLSKSWLAKNCFAVWRLSLQPLPAAIVQWENQKGEAGLQRAPAGLDTRTQELLWRLVLCAFRLTAADARLSRQLSELERRQEVYELCVEDQHREAIEEWRLRVYRLEEEGERRLNFAGEERLHLTRE